MDYSDVIWLIYSELDRAEDQHTRDILTDMKSSCLIPSSSTVDFGYLLNKYGSNFEFPLTFLKKIVSLTKNSNKLLDDAANYIKEYHAHVRYQSNLIKVLNISINICLKPDGGQLIIEHKMVCDILISALASEHCKTLAYETLISYIKLLTDSKKVDCLNAVYQFCCEQNNLDIFCALLNSIPTDLFYSNNVCFKKHTFWQHIESCISGTEPYLRRQGEYILSKYVEHYSKGENNLFSCKNFKETWQAFFMLLDIGKEKQLHLLNPALKLINFVFNLPFIWQQCIFKRYLSHSQTSIVYQVATEVLKGTFFAHHLQEIIYLVFMAINKNEYNKLSCETFQHLREFCQKLDDTDLKIVVDEIVQVAWNPVSFIQVLMSVLTSENAHKVLLEGIFKCASQLPHVYIRLECLKHLIKISWDGKDFNHLAKMLSISKIDIETDLDISEFSYNRDILLESILINLKHGKNIRLGLHILNQFKLNVISNFCHNLGSMDPNTELCIWHTWLNSDDTKAEQKHLIDFVFKYFKTNLCEEYFYVYLELIHLLPMSFIKSIDMEEMIFKPISCPSKYTILQQAVALSLTRRHPEVDVSLLCYLGNPIANIKYATGSTVELYAKHAFVARIFADILFDNLRTEQIEPDLAEEILPLLLDFQLNNKDLLEIYKRIRVIPIKYAGLIECLYSHVTKLKKDQHFKSILITFISILYTYKNANQKFGFIIKDLLKYSEIHPLIRLKFISSIPKLPVDLHNLSTLVDLYLQGMLVTKDENTEYHLCQMFARNEQTEYKDNFNPNVITASATIAAIRKLELFGEQKPQMVMNHLIERYMKHFKKRYFPDSKVHYEKLRIVQMILLLFCHSDNRTETLCEILKVFAYRCLYEETNQTCVRQLLSWILIFGASANPPEILDRIECKDVPVSALINLIPVLYHLAIDKGDENILERVINTALPWTMGPQFRLRVYAQELIRKLLGHFNDKFPDCYKRYAYLKTCIDNSIKCTHEAHRNSLKTDIVFFDMNYSMRSIYPEFILVDIPKLNKVHRSEWECLEPLLPIVPFNFSREVDNFLDHSDSFLKKDTDSLVKFSSEITHIQKKITPWKSTLDNLNAKTKANFVLIASLISKPPNLGGLSRTCEVFGIQDITFNDAKVINDKEFKSLSMSSEGWINAIEVKEPDLMNYVNSLKDEGFCLIGAEQTAGSEQLNKFQFPQKVALVLGNEKTGIPPDIIPLMDKCLEIPQFGQTRSLNVHVAGATFIWEYAKQHLTG